LISVRRRQVIPKIKKNRILSALSRGKRLDGRDLDEYREMKFKVGLIERAEGSAEVLIGATRVLTGVKIEVGKPYPDTPDKGVLIVNAELVPLASPTFEPGPPDENAIELARVVDRALRSAEVVDFGELCLIPGEKVLLLYVDIYVLNHAGNLIDASALSALLALMTAKVPVYEVSESGVEETGEYRPLELLNRPITVTMAKIGDVIVVDPSLDEEEVMDARLSISVDAEGRICAVQKGGPGYFTPDEVEKCVELAFRKSEEIREKVVEGVGQA